MIIASSSSSDDDNHNSSGSDQEPAHASTYDMGSLSAMLQCRGGVITTGSIYPKYET